MGTLTRELDCPARTGVSGVLLNVRNIRPIELYRRNRKYPRLARIILIT